MTKRAIKELRKLLSENLFALREGKGLSRRQLAEVSGIDESVIQRTELGRLPKVESLAFLADALGVEISDLFRKRR